jgi:2-polyprenyl-3-methyl-5-hydroxy-6-metoxy-1,4-benzoquinol methylase
MNASVVDQAYWDNSYRELTFNIAHSEDRVRQWIEQNIPRANGKTCIEIGCFPGRYLAVFGEMGYELSGIDITPRANEMTRWLRDAGYRTGNITRADFLTYEFTTQYDVVCSFGFIEHFTNWGDVLLKHADLVKPGGQLIVETPNFRGHLQRILHSTVDRENYRRHVISSMNPLAWGRLLEQAHFEVTWAGHFGSFDFWADPKPSRLKYATLRLISALVPMLRRIPEGTAALSPYCGLIARKR